jgi:LysR family carnitine catabolism transcriptional activator
MAKQAERVSNESLTIRQLEVFAMASRSATFSEAAKRLGISQPSLSNTIAKIESLLGLSLFDRTTRSLVLTSEGSRLSAMADDLVRDYRATLSSIHDTATDRRGRVSLAVLPSVATSIAPDALKMFFDRYPHVDVALHDSAQDKGLGAIFDRAVDFGIFSRPTDAADLHFDPIYEDDFQLICRSDNALAAKPAASWKDIAKQPFIWTGTGPIRRTVEASWLHANVAITPRFEIEHILTGLGLVSAGLGVTILPGLYLPKVIKEDLRPVRIDRAPLTRQISIVRRTDRVLSQPAQTLVECFRAAFAQFKSKHGATPKKLSSSIAPKN